MNPPRLTELDAAEFDLSRLVEVRHDKSGLVAFIALDDLTLGPGAGGIRTWQYASRHEACVDATKLAKAMTIKCALGQVAAGGAKIVVLNHDGLDRPTAFSALGEAVETFGGLVRTAGDLGTGPDDLAAAAGSCRYVYTREEGLLAAAGRGWLRCLEALVCELELAKRPPTVLVQGAGDIGGAVARAAYGAGAEVLVADVDSARAETLVSELGDSGVSSPRRGAFDRRLDVPLASSIAADEVFRTEVDVVAPCAVGGVVNESVASVLRATSMCGAANNIFASRAAESQLVARGVPWVPDAIASAGAVVEGVGDVVMGLADRSALVDALGTTAAKVLAEARRSGRSANEVAEAVARRRINEG